MTTGPCNCTPFVPDCTPVPFGDWTTLDLSGWNGWSMTTQTNAILRTATATGEGGVMAQVAAGHFRDELLKVPSGGTDPWDGDFTHMTTLDFSANADANSHYTLGLLGSLNEIFVSLWKNNAGPLFINLSDNTTSSDDFISIVNTPASDMHLKWSLAGTTVRAKVWGYGETEPAWQLEMPVADPGTSRQFYVSFSGTPATSIGTATNTTGMWFFPDCAPVPTPNQPVRNEVVGTGDGSTLAFTTSFPYIPGSIMAYSGGILSRVNTTTPSGGAFTFLSPPPLGAPITVTYKAVG